jgi:hypothetical protein
MAQIGALFRPDDLADWPSNDPSDPFYQVDLLGLSQPLINHVH